MHPILKATVLAVATTTPAWAQDDAAGRIEMSCGDFLALAAEEQMVAMLEIRAAYSGEPVAVEEEGEDATVVTGATEAGASGGADGGPTELPHVAATPEAHQRLSGMRTSCTGASDVSAIDALVAAHADYDPVIDEETPND